MTAAEPATGPGGGPCRSTLTRYTQGIPSCELASTAGPLFSPLESDDVSLPVELPELVEPPEVEPPDAAPSVSVDCLKSPPTVTTMASAFKELVAIGTAPVPSASAIFCASSFAPEPYRMTVR